MPGPADKYDLGKLLTDRVLDEITTRGITAEGQVVQDQDVRSLLVGGPISGVISLNDTATGKLYIMGGYRIANCVIHPGTREDLEENSEDFLDYEEM